MASSIDATKPADNSPALTSDLRANLLAAKTEIEALQAAVASALVAKAGDTMTGALNWAATQTIASAATTDIGAATSNSVIVSGTTTITALGTIAAGAERVVQFSGALTLTHNATSLILPGGASITTAAGDVAYFVSLGSGNWRCTGYQKANGQPVAGVGVALVAQALSPGMAVNVYNDAGTAKVRKAIATSVDMLANGFVMDAASVGQMVNVYSFGLNNAVSGLTPGVLYLSATTAGAYTSTAPTTPNLVQELGFAISATLMAFQRQPVAGGGATTTAKTYEDYQAHVLADAPVAYWPMDDDVWTSATLQDASGNANHATWYAAPNKASPASGYSSPIRMFPLRAAAGKTAVFVGASNNRATASVPLGTSYSVEAWLLPDTTALSGWRVCIGAAADAGGAFFYFRSSFSGGDGVPGIQVSASVDMPVTPDCRMLASQPTYLCATVGGGAIRVFVNGHKMKESSLSGVTLPAQASGNPIVLFAGYHNASGTVGGSAVVDYYMGALCDVALYNYTLSEARIQARYELAMMS